MSQTKYCIKCGLKHGHPGIKFDDKGFCNLCKFDFPEVLTNNYKKIQSSYHIYEKSAPISDNNHDCLLMLSGGKDSIYMLDKLVREDERKVLAYTFDIPFESKEALKNIELCKDIINCDYVLDSNEIKYKKMMKYLFENLREKRTGKYLDEKTPCQICGHFILMSAFFYAYKHNIPFVLQCMDPMQMLTFSLDIKEIINGYLDWFGKELCTDIFSYPIEELLEKEEDELPKIVFPYYPYRTTYNMNVIIDEVKKKGLYNSNPMKTHCTLLGLLNYCSIKNWDCIYYKLEYSMMARSGMISPDVVLNHEKEMKNLIGAIVNKRQISVEQKERFIKSWNSIGSSTDAEHLFFLVSNITEAAEVLNLTLEYL